MSLRGIKGFVGGISHETVRKILDEESVPARNPQIVAAMERKAMARQMHSNGLQDDQIAASLKVSSEVVRDRYLGKAIIRKEVNLKRKEMTRTRTANAKKLVADFLADEGRLPKHTELVALAPTYHSYMQRHGKSYKTMMSKLGYEVPESHKKPKGFWVGFNGLLEAHKLLEKFAQKHKRLPRRMEIPEIESFILATRREEGLNTAQIRTLLGWPKGRKV